MKIFLKLSANSAVQDHRVGHSCELDLSECLRKRWVLSFLPKRRSWKRQRCRERASFSPKKLSYLVQYWKENKHSSEIKCKWTWVCPNQSIYIWYAVSMVLVCSFKKIHWGYDSFPQIFHTWFIGFNTRPALYIVKRCCGILHNSRCIKGPLLGLGRKPPLRTLLLSNTLRH